MSEIRKKTMRLALIAGAMTLILLFTGCAPAPAAATPTPAAVITETVVPSPSPTTTITPTPTVVLTPTAAPTTMPSPAPAVSLPPIPKNFMVEDEYWEFALFLHDPDGNSINGGVVFSGFPEGMKLYAPMSGYITVSSGDNPFPHVRIYISEVADDVTKWDEFGPTTGKFITFDAEEIELFVAEVRDGSLYVEKGKPFAEVTKKAEMLPGEFEEKPELMVVFDKDWADMLDVSIGNPREYAWSAIQIYEREEGS